MYPSESRESECTVHTSGHGAYYTHVIRYTVHMCGQVLSSHVWSGTQNTHAVSYTVHNTHVVRYTEHTCGKLCSAHMW